MAGQPTGTVTMLFTDVEGSTRLLERLGRDRYARSLELHRELLRAAFERSGGFEVSCEGDAFFVAFPRAEDAVRAASAAQQALAAADWPEGLAFPVRMGIHTGEPKVVPPNYVGLDVHRAARVMSVSSGGQILLTARTTDLVDGDLPDGLGLRQLGRFRLKDFDRPEPLSQLVVDGLPADLPPPRAERAVEAPASRRRWVVVAAVAVIGAGAAAAAVLLTGSGSGATSNVVVSIDSRGKSVAGRTSVGNSPTSIAAGAEGVWVINAADGTVSELDRSGHLVRTFGTNGGNGPADVATSPGAVWVAGGPDTVLKIDPTTGNTLTTLPLRLAQSHFGPFMWLTVARGSLWVSAQDRLVRIDLATLRVVKTRLPSPDWGSIAVTANAVWESTHDALYHLDAQGRHVLGSVAVPQGPIKAAAGYIWAVNSSVDAVAQVDPRTNTILRTIDVGNGPTGIAYGDGLLWVTSEDGTVTAIDPGTAAVKATVRVGGTPQDAAVAFGRVWIAAS